MDPADPAYERWVDVVPESPDEVLGGVALLSSADGAGDVATVLAVHTPRRRRLAVLVGPDTAARLGTVAGPRPPAAWPR